MLCKYETGLAKDWTPISSETAGHWRPWDCPLPSGSDQQHVPHAEDRPASHHQEREEASAGEEGEQRGGGGGGGEGRKGEGRGRGGDINHFTSFPAPALSSARFKAQLFWKRTERPILRHRLQWLKHGALLGDAPPPLPPHRGHDQLQLLRLLRPRRSRCQQPADGRANQPRSGKQRPNQPEADDDEVWPLRRDLRDEQQQWQQQFQFPKVWFWKLWRTLRGSWYAWHTPHWDQPGVSVVCARAPYLPVLCAHICCTCVHVCSYLHVLDEYSCPCIDIYICTTPVLIIGVVWCLHGIHTVLYLLLRVDTIPYVFCVWCLHGIHTVFCIFSHPWQRGEPGFEALSLLCTELVCTVTTIFCSLCKTEIPLFCTVYSKERIPNVHLYHNLHFSTPKTHSFLLFFRW